MKQSHGLLTRWLESAPRFVFNLFAASTAFSTYFCMYAFRKPFSAALYHDPDTGEDLQLWGTQIGLKTAFVISQIMGYALSKFLGIKFCSEMTRARRAIALVVLIVLAEAALLLFAVLPPNGKVFAIFLNGLPLGMVWGMVVWYLEGRRASELLLAGLSCSFIISSGIVKDLGLWLMDDFGVTEYWMPLTIGYLFLPLFLLSVWLLDQLPEPTEADIAERMQREPMDATHRVSFARHFLGGLVALMLFYFFLTAYRDYRDNYGVEMLMELGLRQANATDRLGEPQAAAVAVDATPTRNQIKHVFTRTEIPVAFGVLASLAALSLIRSNQWALLAMFALMTLGTILMGVSTLLFRKMGAIDAYTWIILVGFGAYLAYVPFGSMLFDRIIASTHVVGTAVFAIYVADAIGYVGSIFVQIYKDFFAQGETRLEFFCGLSYFISILGTVCLITSCIYFLWRHGDRRRAG